MTSHEYVLFDPLFDELGAEAMVRLCERFGTYGMYSQESVESEIGRGLTQRHDAVRNYLRSGGMRGEEEPVQVAAARTNYFREEYAYGTSPLIEGIQPFLFHEGFVEAARQIHGRAVVEPAIVFANLMVPGQELALHTDVPEFRGANRKLHPQWLLVAMRHSGLFEDWRMPIATGVAWFSDGGGLADRRRRSPSSRGRPGEDDAEGGEFVFYPDGADGPRASHEVAYNTAVLIDTDSVFHGVDRVASDGGPLPRLRPGMQLVFDGDGRWSVRDDDAVRERYAWEELRFSVSWKAYCFADEAERDAWRSHTDDLDLDRTLATLVDDLRARGRITGETPPPSELAILIIDEYIRFPAIAV